MPTCPAWLLLPSRHFGSRARRGDGLALCSFIYCWCPFVHQDGALHLPLAKNAACCAFSGSRWRFIRTRLAECTLRYVRKSRECGVFFPRRDDAEPRHPFNAFLSRDSRTWQCWGRAALLGLLSASLCGRILATDPERLRSLSGEGDELSPRLFQVGLGPDACA